MPLYERKYEGRCHVCQFVEREPELGEMLEAWILDPGKDNQSVCDYFNERFGKDEHGTEDPDWNHLTTQKLRNHSQRHLTNHHEMFVRAQQKALTGNITHESAVVEQLTVLNTLKQQGQIKVAQGDIQIRSLNDLLRVFEWEHKILGGDKLEIKIGGSGGMNIPPQLIGAMLSVMREFVPADSQQDLRQRLDEVVFPQFEKYAQMYQEETGQLPPGLAPNEEVTEADVVEEEDLEGDEE